VFLCFHRQRRVKVVAEQMGRRHRKETGRTSTQGRCGLHPPGELGISADGLSDGLDVLPLDSNQAKNFAFNGAKLFRRSLGKGRRCQVRSLCMAEASRLPVFLRQRVCSRVSTASESTTSPTRARRAGSWRFPTEVSRRTRDCHTLTVSTELMVVLRCGACEGGPAT
jgi:hypothetical protein